MNDALATLGVIPSDRKKLESMGITTLEQIALSSVQALGMGPGKGTMLIQRARNILANQNILTIDVVSDDLVEITVKKRDRAVIKSVLNALDVYAVGWGNAALSIEGNLLRLTKKSPAFSQVITKAEGLKEILEAKQLQDQERFGITLPEDTLRQFAKDRGFDGFWQNVFHDIQGNDTMKKVVATSLFSTFEEPVHSLIIGEPGSSKTMAKEIISTDFTDIITIGANTTRSGLVCHLGTGELGALPHADHKIILVDEFDKIPEDDIEYCYELLSNGKCSVHSAKLHQTIESQFIMIAFANPRTKIFGKTTPLSDIGLSPLLLSRCALVVRVENISREDRLALFRKKFYGAGEAHEKHDYYDQWLKLARTYTPTITATDTAVERYLQDMDTIVETHINTTLRRDLRMSDYLRRIPLAVARASFSPVNNTILKQAMDITKESLETWAQ
jgi:DNA replicative helicase MCM subunit Mcm2 (Cdc46/Mcm family)